MRAKGGYTRPAELTEDNGTNEPTKRGSMDEASYIDDNNFLSYSKKLFYPSHPHRTSQMGFCPFRNKKHDLCSLSAMTEAQAKQVPTGPNVTP
jgi:hypothetical protein